MKLKLTSTLSTQTPFMCSDQKQRPPDLHALAALQAGDLRVFPPEKMHYSGKKAYKR